MPSDSACQLCRRDALTELLDLGPQPISNRFLADPAAAEARFPLTLAQCNACGLAQLSRTVPARELRSPYAWVTYHEPESHLDRLADRIAHLPGLVPDALILGLSFKDDSLLRRLPALGYRRTYRLDPAQDLQIEVASGVESIQDRLDVRRAESLIATHGKAQVVVARHILEHAHNLHRFLAGLRALLAPEGYLVLEVPDCQIALRLGDCTTLWEEHIVYFTPSTFRQLFPQVGWRLFSLDVFPYRLENLLVGIAQAGSCSDVPHAPPDLKTELATLRTFAEGLPQQRQRFAQYLGDFRRQQGPIAVLGAGHLACAFINYLQLEPHIAFVVDDDPHKQGLFMPGSHLPIRSSQALLEENVRLCLLSVNPEVEEKVLQRNHGFVERGGRFASMFAASNRALFA